MRIDDSLTPADLLPAVNRVFDLAGRKVRAIDRAWDPSKGSPVFTVKGKYTSRGWTEWTQGFQFGCPLLVFDGTDDRELLELGRSRTLEHMPAHLTHTGVHDHGFNTISTYGNLRRLMREGRFDHNEWEQRYYELAIKVSGAVQASRWARHGFGLPYVYSFNGPQSLFIDTMRTLRVLVLAHQLGHVLMEEDDQSAPLLQRAVEHMFATYHTLVFRGDTDHAYDVRGRTAHEGVFNVNGGQFRCRSTQQGYSPFSTWTRGLAWAMLGYAEQLEALGRFGADEWSPGGAPPSQKEEHVERLTRVFLDTAISTCDHYIADVTASNGIPYWDDGAPGLHQLGDWRDEPANPYNDHEPVDSSAAAIAAQGLLRLGRLLGDEQGHRYIQAGLTVARTLFSEPYLSTDTDHQGLLLHSVYHRPNGWDHIPKGRKVPCDESSMWGDYHLLELAVYIQRLASGGPYLAFFDQA